MSGSEKLGFMAQCNKCGWYKLFPFGTLMVNVPDVCYECNGMIAIRSMTELLPETERSDYVKRE